MKFLHTGDWHIGKRLEGSDRLAEQLAVLGEISAIAVAEKVDIIFVCGDIFDTVMPTSEAETLLYSELVRLTDGGRIPIILLSGNHDDAERLSAPAPIALTNNIFLIGGVDNSLFLQSPLVQSCGFAGLNMEIGGEKLNLAILPYPSDSRMASLTGEKITDDNYSERVTNWLKKASENFKERENNFVLSHLFCVGSIESDERLGTSRLVPTTVFPESTFVALGHIHKPQKVADNIMYSGSIINYHFGSDNDKSVVVGEAKEGVLLSTKRIPLTSGKNLIQVTCHSIEECYAKLAENSGNYVSLIYYAEKPMLIEELEKLKSYDSYCKLEIKQPALLAETISRKSKSDMELFTEYYGSRYPGKEPDDELKELFSYYMNKDN